jgi:small subunit ribosomal protein S15
MQTLKPASEVTVAPPLAARTRLFSAVERGTSVLEDTEGLGAEFEGELIDDAAWDTEESGDEDLLAGFDLENADVGEIREWSITPRQVCAQERAEAKAEFKRHDKDVGSSEVQIALFTARIKHITDHVISNPKDHASRRGLLALVSKRRRLINYLYSRDAAKAKKLTNDLGIRFKFTSAIPDRTEKYRQYTIAANKKNKK